MFPWANEVSYLDTAAEGLPAPGCAEAVQRYFQAKNVGTPGRKQFHRVEAEALERAAQLLGTTAENVTFLSSASEALNVLANSIDWRAGDEVVISDLEFPSNVFPWLRLQQKGVRVRLAHDCDGALRWEAVAECISSRTRLISVSLVSYKSGAYFPWVTRLAAEAHRVGAILSIDATQALGRCPVSVEGVDYLMSSSFKWLLGPHGLGLVYMSPGCRRKLGDPASIGWYSVRDVFSPNRFQSYELKDGARSLAAGMPNFVSIYALDESLAFLLGIGIEQIFSELRPLVERLRRGLEELGCSMLTPAGPEYASGIVAFTHPAAQDIGAALDREGIVIWGGDQRVRASVHLYNNEHDIGRCLRALSPILDELNVHST